MPVMKHVNYRKCRCSMSRRMLKWHAAIERSEQILRARRNQTILFDEIRPGKIRARDSRPQLPRKSEGAARSVAAGGAQARCRGGVCA